MSFYFTLSDLFYFIFTIFFIFIFFTESWSTKLKLLLAGAFSGALAKTTVSPWARITVLFQVQGTGDANLKVPAQYTKSVASAVQGIYQNEGIFALERF
jgi:hypothetical protein